MSDLSELGDLNARVERALPDGRVRVRQLAALADSAEYIAGQDVSMLIVQVRLDRIRLFAGGLIVLSLSKDYMWLATDPSFAFARLGALDCWQFDEEVYPEYRRPPSCNGFYRPLRDLSADWSIVQDAHFSYLDQVLREGRKADPRSGAQHESLMFDYLTLTLGREIDGVPSKMVPKKDDDTVKYWEGSALRVPVTRFERDRKARRKCLEVQGHHCAVCAMSFGDRYGAEVVGLIHVHHVTLLSQRGGGYSPDPIRDLVPVCPNCHAVIHATPGKVRSIKEVREMLRSRKTV